MHHDYLISKFEQTKHRCGTTDKSPASGVHFDPVSQLPRNLALSPLMFTCVPFPAALMFDLTASTMIYLIVQHPPNPRFVRNLLEGMDMFLIECFHSGHSEVAEDEAPDKAHVWSFLSNAGVVRSSYHNFPLSADHGNIYHMFHRSLVDQPNPRKLETPLGL